MRRWVKVLIAALAALAVLLVLNAVVLDRQTKPAEVTVEGGEILRLPGGDLQVAGHTGLVGFAGTAPPGEPVRPPLPPPPVVLLHCFTCAVDWWDGLIPRLRGAGIPVIAVDLLGHGGSEKPDGGYSIENQAQLVAQALDRLRIKGRATVVGHSLGGAVATALAEQSPQLVGGVAIIDTEPDTSYGSLSLLARATTAPVLGEALWRVKMDWSIRDGLKEAFAPGYDVPDEFVEDVKRMTYSAYDGSHSAFDSYVEESSLDERLRHVGVPLLAMFGAEEQIVDDPREALSAYAGVPGAQTELIAGAGHSPNVERPAETARLILGLAKKVETGREDRSHSARPRRIVADCNDAVIGPGRPNWRQYSTVAGPFGLGGPGRNFQSKAVARVGNVWVAKIPAIVEGHRPVILRAPASEAERVGLIYGPIHSARAVREGALKVTFKPCQDRPRTGFPGALVLGNRQPITLDVVFAGSVREIRIG